jgi:hypothetical protein
LGIRLIYYLALAAVEMDRAADALARLEDVKADKPAAMRCASLGESIEGYFTWWLFDVFVSMRF